MKYLSWNCRFLNASNNAVVPYLFWLLLHFTPTFLFLQETKTNVDVVYNILISSNPSCVLGVDAKGTQGG